MYSSIIFFQKEPLEAEPEACQVLLALWEAGERQEGWVMKGRTGGAYESATNYQLNLF